MSLAIHHQADVAVVAVSGEFTHELAPRFEEAVSQELEAGRREFIVDLRALEGIDSAGLEAFTSLQRRCQEQLGIVSFCGATPTLRKILELTRLDRSFDLRDDLEDAPAGIR